MTVNSRARGAQSGERPTPTKGLTEKVPGKPKRNLLNGLGLERVDYKDTSTLRLFISDRGRIRARHVTGLTVRQQREVATAVKNAREMALLPYGSTRA